MSRPLLRRLLRPLLLLALLATTGCQVDVQVGVDVEQDGSGQVSVAVALDEAAAARVPDLADQLEVEDLVEAGWVVTGPSPEADGRTWVRATKPFSSAEEAGRVLDEITGADGPFRDLEVRRTSSLLVDEWDLAGTVDLTGGLAGFSDDALRERLDGTDVGMTEAEIVAVAGRPLDEAVTFQVAVSLPGEITSSAPAEVGGAAVWQPALGERVALVATGSRLHTDAVAWFVVAAVAAVALVAVVLLRGSRRRRSRRRRRRGRARVAG